MPNVKPLFPVSADSVSFLGFKDWIHAQDIQRPQIIVAHGGPDTFRCKSFAVVHVALEKDNVDILIITDRSCVRTLVGSSRRMRLTAMVSSLSVNQPLGRNHALV